MPRTTRPDPDLEPVQIICPRPGVDPPKGSLTELRPYLTGCAGCDTTIWAADPPRLPAKLRKHPVVRLCPDCGAAARQGQGAQP